MTFIQHFEQLKDQFSGADVSDIKEHLAYQFQIEDRDSGGIFYVEVKDGQLFIEPYEYYDRDAIFILSWDTLTRIVNAKMDPVLAFTIRKLKLEGNIEKALRLKEIIERK